ncbi:hypothetical protein GCM10009347_29920 [Shewanella algicola]|nr:hypothetical protein GCM10009347_29920 [Shewanella algicola]
MTITDSFLIILCLIGISCFFSMSEIALAASRKIRLQTMADEGDLRATKVLKLQAHPGSFFTVVQIGLNAVAIMGGIIGESAFRPYFEDILLPLLGSEWGLQLSFVFSFVTVTSLFILFADLMPKRIAMVLPEQVAVTFVMPIAFCITVLKPFVWIFNGLANAIFKLLQVPTARNDQVTHDDIYAMMTAGTEAGVMDKGEQQMMENVFEMQSVSVTSAMTARESLVYFYCKTPKKILNKRLPIIPIISFWCVMVSWI